MMTVILFLFHRVTISFAMIQNMFLSMDVDLLYCYDEFLMHHAKYEKTN